MSDQLVSAGGRIAPLVRLQPVVSSANDNLGRTRSGAPDSLSDPDPDEAAPQPEWSGPGHIVSIGMQDGRHRMGTVRAVEVPGGPDPWNGEVQAVLVRLLAHYGAWLGFEGEVKTMRAGVLRHLPVAVGPSSKVEYRVELSRIGRRGQSLTADATILRDGHPAVTLDGFSIAFRPALPGARPAAPAPKRLRAAIRSGEPPAR